MFKNQFNTKKVGVQKLLDVVNTQSEIYGGNKGDFREIYGWLPPFDLLWQYGGAYVHFGEDN